MTHNPGHSAAYQRRGVWLLPWAQPRQRRLTLLLVGLWLFGAGLALTIEANLGADPWTVFHEGVAERGGLSIGMVTVLTGLVILAALVMFSEPIGLGTVANALIVGLAIDATLWLIPPTDLLALRAVMLGAAPVVIGVASALYLGAGCGPGPRDGLMTALQRRGVATWQARTGIELCALIAGVALGGTFGVGTVWVALTLGPCVQFFLQRFPERRLIGPVSDPRGRLAAQPEHEAP